MADSCYRQLQAVDGPSPEHGAQIIDAETCQCPLYSGCTPSPDIQDLAVQHCQTAHGSESTPHHETSLPVDCEISNSSVSVRMRDNEPGNGFQGPALDEQAKNLHPSWTDPYFRLPFLISMSLFLIGIIAVLEALYYISQHNQGLATASEEMHYFWTYGPTFVLTLVAVLWNQLEQRARQILPWCLMSRGEIPAQNSLMLNYVTSSTLGSLVRSLKRKHSLVSISIFGSLTFRLIIIFSAGLLRLEYRSLTFRKVLSAEDIFDPTKNVNYSFWDEVEMAAFVADDLNYWAIFKYGLSYPHGTTSQFAVQSFSTSDDGDSHRPYDQLEGDIQVFQSSLENCDLFKFTYHTEDWFEPECTRRLATPGSGLKSLRPWCYASPSICPNPTENVADNFHEAVNNTKLIYKCTNSTAIEDQDHRILFALEYRLSSHESEVSGFMCEPTYSLTRRAVTNSTRDAGVQDSLKITGAIIETLDMGIRPFNMTDNILMGLSGGGFFDIPNLEWNTWYTLLNATQPQTDLWSFRNTSLVMELSQQMWKGLTAYIVKHDYTAPSNETINGTATSTQGRVCVQELSLRLVEAHVAVLLGLTVAMCFLRPSLFLRDPTSLAAHSTILGRSPGLMNLLKGYGAASKQELRISVSGYQASFPMYLSVNSSAISLHRFSEKSEAISEKHTADSRNRREWWSPVSVRWWFRICLMTAILVVAIALEALPQISEHENGLGDVILDGYLKYTWSFLPSLVLVLVGLLFSMIDSTARTSHAFQLLRKGRATMEDILHDPARQVSLVAVVYAVWKRHFVLLWAIIPSLIAPMLTVITSGLYTVAPVPLTYDTELELKEWFRLENRTIDGYGADDAYNTFALTQYSGMSYPQWTQGEYAFASFRADNLHSHTGNDSSLSVTARVPATRVNLNCSLIGQYANDTYPPTLESSYGPERLFVVPRPLGCHSNPEQSDTAGNRDLYLGSAVHVDVDDTRNTSRGCYLAYLQDDYSEFLLFNYTKDLSLAPSSFTNCSSVCGDKREHHFIGFGYGTEALALLHCVPFVETLWVTAAFALPDLSLISDVPITPDRDSAVFLSNAAGMDSILLPIWDDIAVAITNRTSGIGNFKRLPSDPDNGDTGRLIAAVESIPAEYFAQVLHFNYRLPIGDNENNASSSSAGQNLLTPDGQPATGTVTDLTRLRLKQNAVSTRILQSLLGVVGACLIASTALGRGARVIPRDPGSIASKMAYFADGEIWRHVPVGADRWTDEQIKKHGVGISGGKLLLDWWGDDREDSGDGARGKKFAVDRADRK